MHKATTSSPVWFAVVLLQPILFPSAFRTCLRSMHQFSLGLVGVTVVCADERAPQKAQGLPTVRAMPYAVPCACHRHRATTEAVTANLICAFRSCVWATRNRRRWLVLPQLSPTQATHKRRSAAPAASVGMAVGMGQPQHRPTGTGGPLRYSIGCRGAHVRVGGADAATTLPR